jgi:hypothetical protein
MQAVYRFIEYVVFKSPEEHVETCTVPVVAMMAKRSMVG